MEHDFQGSRLDERRLLLVPAQISITGGDPGQNQQKHPHRLQSTEPAVTAPSLGWYRRPMFILLAERGGGVEGKHRVWKSTAPPSPPRSALSLVSLGRVLTLPYGVLLLDDGGVRPWFFFLLFFSP